jgi:hypothetical protein
VDVSSELRGRFYSSYKNIARLWGLRTDTLVTMVNLWSAEPNSSLSLVRSGAVGIL